MASVRKHGDKWQARIQRRGQPSISKSFNNKADALKWARNTESQVDLGTLAPKQAMPRLSRILERYLEEVSPSKKGALQEKYRVAQVRKAKLADAFIDRVDGGAVAKYRDERLKVVSPNTVRLELALLSAVFEQCRKEWGYPVANPVREIRIPKPGLPRKRRLEPGEETVLLAACERSGSRYLVPLVILAIETGMRLSELASMTWRNVDLQKRTVYLPDTKNGSTRTIPLSSRAVRVLKEMPVSINGRVFVAKVASIKIAFRNALGRARSDTVHGAYLVGLRFHDLRHEAVTRLFEKGLNPIEVGMVSGHKTLSMLQRYTHLRSEDLVAKLA
jgi:integrase